MASEVVAIDRIILLKQEQLAGYDIVALTFAEAYAELRRQCPDGDLHFRLYVHRKRTDVEDCEHCGGPKDCRWAGGEKDCSNGCTVRAGRSKLTTHERHQLAADNGVDTWEDYRGER
jgi:hypothetical protein